MANVTKFDVVIIGGGAAGMMAAIVAARRGKSVLILEKNSSLGEKLKITGGGRCNITNAEPDLPTFLKNYGKAAQFLYSPFAQFGVADTFTFFESLKLPLVTQALNRVFPQTEKAFDVYDSMINALQVVSVTIKTQQQVKHLKHETGRILSVETENATYRAEAFILATGGISHPETGSTGDGFGWLKDLGHTVHQPTSTV